MFRLCIRLLIVSLLLLFSIGVFAQDYIPLTSEQAKNWLSDRLKNNPQEAYDFIIKYDYVEHAKPIVILPSLFAVLDNKDLVVGALNKQPITFKLGTNSIGYLEYEWEIPTLRSKDFAPKPNNSWVWWVGVGSFSLGVAVASLLAILVAR